LAHISAKVREKLLLDPAVLLILDADSLAATVAAGAAGAAEVVPVARDEGERTAFLLLESGCEYLKGDDFLPLLLPFVAPEA
jgi:hypothetical protein